VPHVRPTCPGVPWGVHGPRKMGAALSTLLQRGQKGYGQEQDSLRMQGKHLKRPFSAHVR